MPIEEFAKDVYTLNLPSKNIKVKTSKLMKNLSICALITFGLIGTTACSSTGTQKNKTQTEGPFEPTLESLSHYETPEWFRDAKFGIYVHWNAYSASKSNSNGWYARNMYIQGHPAYEDHLKNWGHPSEVGYKDVVKAWEAPKFDAEEWVRLFKGAGAKYIVTVAIHHDNFDMWDSKYQPRWNSLNYGPKVDVCAEMRRETLEAGLRWGVTTHLGRTYSWFQTNKMSDETGPLKGVPYDGNDPEYEDLYLPQPDFSKLGDAGDMKRHPLESPEWWKEHWKKRIIDLIENYHPDHLYFDGGMPFMDDNGQAGLDVIAHYYNHNASLHDGENQGVMVVKAINRHGIYHPGVSNVVMERKSSPHLETIPKQTENSLGPWFNRPTNQNYRATEILLHEMIDAVSKNNNYMLNIPAAGDGSIDPNSQAILEDFGNWFEVNGEAIYETRPWLAFGEGNIRFTTKGATMYATVLGELPSSLTIESFKNWSTEDIVNIELLGGKGDDLSWKMTEGGLEIFVSSEMETLAPVFKITCTKDVSKMPVYEVAALPSVEEANRKAAAQFGADGDGREVLESMQQYKGIQLTADVENSSPSTYGGSVLYTVDDPAAIMPAQSWSSQSGFHGDAKEGEAIKLVYSLTDGPITVSKDGAFVVDLYGRNRFNDRAQDITIELRSGGVDGKLVASATGLAFPEKAPYHLRKELSPKSAFDTVVVIGHDTTEGAGNSFTLMELRVSSYD